MLSRIKADAVKVPKTIGYKFRKGLTTLADEEEACQSSCYAYYFAYDIPGADIARCQESACKNSECAYNFAKSVPGADIEKCQEAACKDSRYAYWFARDVPGADKEKCRNACKGSAYAF